MNKYFFALPSYLGKSDFQQYMKIMPYYKNGSYISCVPSSAIYYSCNVLWAMALNARKEGITHFVMLHSDIIPEDDNWLDILNEEMEKTTADVLSVVVPIKNTSGFTSTGLVMNKDNWEFKRFSLDELYGLPETFTSDDLIVNNGLILIDLRKSWCEKIYFRIDNKICFDEEKNEFVIKFLPDDAAFSMDARKLGANIYATRKVKVKHIGDFTYTNYR